VKVFSGFPAGKARNVALPDSFFDGLLPLIDDLAELKVTLVCLRLLALKQGRLRWITQSELVADRDLLRALSDQAEVERGLQRALARGTLLLAHEGASGEALYFANTERGRAATAALARGESLTTIELAAQRPTIFQLYEHTIGALTPLIADELREAAQEFPATWIEDAFRDAARQNARSWAYVRKILDNRARRGKRDEGQARDVGREWQDFIGRESAQEEDDGDD
jgi:DnaD/phage-associated family protein